MKPIEKNIIVADEQGNEYEATYAKRAKGLVKNGRARFIDKNRICLACPPNKILEDKKMSEKTDSTEPVENTDIDNIKGNSKFSMDYILEQIEKLANNTEYLNQVISELRQTESVGPGDIGAASKADALGNVVKSRETTNQQLLKLYEKIYDDLIQRPNLTSKFNEITDWAKSLNRDEFDPITWEAVVESLKAQLRRNR